MIKLIMEDNNLINKYTNKHRTFKYSPDNKFITVYVDGRNSGVIFNNDKIITIDGDKVKSSDFFECCSNESVELVKENMNNDMYANSIGHGNVYYLIYTPDSHDSDEIAMYIHDLIEDEQLVPSRINDFEEVARTIVNDMTQQFGINCDVLEIDVDDILCSNNRNQSDYYIDDQDTTYWIEHYFLDD